MKTLQTDKLRYIYLGQTTFGEDIYTLLESDLSPEQILNRVSKNLLTDDSFKINPPGWNGVAKLSHICESKGFKPKEKISLTTPLVFHGSDSDHGKEYSWTVKVDALETVEAS